MAEALKLVKTKLVNVMAELAKFADTYKELPTLAFTHFQPAQPTTVGKRATLWLQEFMMDLEDLEYVAGSLRLLGSKGTTGTQASFLEPVYYTHLLQFDSGNLRITMDRKTLKEIEKRISADVYLEIRKADKDILSRRAKKLVGKHTIYCLYTHLDVYKRQYGKYLKDSN